MMYRSNKFAERSTRIHRSRGVAIMLVIITMGLVTVLALSFLNSQATVTGIAENVRRSSEARAVAETGLDLAVEFIRGTPDWREKLINGVWLENTPFANGVFQVTGVDPFDSNLADDVTDMAMITSVGYVDGVSFTCRASVRPRDIRIAHWELDEPAGSVNITDLIGGHNGACINSPSFKTQGIWDSAVRFDGVNDCIRVEHSSEFVNKNGTVALWFKTTTTGVAQGLFSKDTCGNGDGHFMIWCEPATIGVRIQRGGSSYAVQQGGIQTYRWYHVAATFGSQGVKLYLDGNLIGTDPFTGGMEGNTLPILLGATSFTNCGSAPQWHLNGWLDDVRVYSEQLTAAEIALLAQIPVPVPNVGHWALDEAAVGPAYDMVNDFDGTIHGEVLTGQEGVLGTSMEHRGQMYPLGDPRNPWVEIPHQPSMELADGTISVWFKPNAIGSNMMVYTKDHDVYLPNGGHILMAVRPDGKLSCRMQSSTNDYFIETAPGAINAGNWYHTVVTFGALGMELYLDSVLIGADPYTGGIQTNQELLLLGASNAMCPGTPDYLDYFDGCIDDFRIYDYQLSADEIAAIYDEPNLEGPVFVRSSVKYEID